MLGSLEVLCGQMLVVGLAGTELTASEQRALAAGKRAGVVLFRRNIAASMGDVAALNAAVLEAAPVDLPPLIAVDQEGGRVMRLGLPAVQLPPMRTLGGLNDVALVRRLAEAQARELAALGFTMTFSPVADVHTHDENPIIGDRAFASSPEAVAAMASAFAEGLKRGGVLSCAKHFPGHGDTTVDSHLALPRVDRALADLERLELAPFRALAQDQRVDAMMTAHVVYPALDAAQPATLSHAICTRLLRETMGFEGVLFSDDLEMKALTMPIAEAAVRAVAAGCDVLLLCSREGAADEAHEALIREAEKSTVFKARCEQALLRAVAMRRRVSPSPVAREAELARVFEASRPMVSELESRLASCAKLASK